MSFAVWLAVEDNSMETGVEIALAPAEKLEAHFLPLFQSGLYLRGITGVSVRRFLTEQIDVTDQYLEKRIQTVFLDGRAVDDLDSTNVHAGSVLTLSAAMPGLLGATLRVGSHYAAMRSQISHQGEGNADSGEGFVLLKLFNLLIRELGPGLLKRGIWIKGERLAEFFESLPELFWKNFTEAEVNGRPAAREELEGLPRTEGLVMIRLKD